MKFKYLTFILFALVLSSCSTSDKVTATWINEEVMPKGPFKSIFVLTLTDNSNSQLEIEERIASLITKRGGKAVKSSDLFPPGFLATGKLSKEKLIEVINKAGCDAVFTVALLATKKESNYSAGMGYYPANYGYYGNYYGYYNYYSTMVYTPGYYTESENYFIETNIYEVETDLLLWSVQSTSLNPTSLDKWFTGYSNMILYNLKKSGLVTR